MVKLVTYSLLACVTSALIAGGCKQEEEEAKNIPLQENVHPSPVSKGQRKLDSSLTEFNTQLKILDEKVQLANARISKMGKKKNWSWRNKVEIVKAKKKKVLVEAMELGKKETDQHATGLPKLIASVEALSRDMDMLLKKMR